MYSLELLQAINDWHCMGVGNNKAEIAERIIIHSKNLPEQFKTLNSKCYRRIGLTGENSLKLGINMKLPETYSSWTFDITLAKEFNGGVPPKGYQGLIFQIDETYSKDDVIINLYELYKDQSFLDACEEHKDSIESYKTGIGYFMNSESEVILKVDNLTTSQIYAYGGYSSSQEKLMEDFFGYIPNQKEVEFFNSLITKQNITIGANWITDAAKDRTIDFHIGNAKRLSNLVTKTN